MKLWVMDCKHYGGVKASNGKYICNSVLNSFKHPVDGLDHAYDASWSLRMAPNFNRLMLRHGGEVVGGETRWTLIAPNWRIAFLNCSLSPQALHLAQKQIRPANLPPN